MSRITKYDREQMVEAIVKHGFEKQLAQVNASLDLLGDKFYADIFGPVQKHIAALPKGFAYVGRSFNVNVNGQRRKIQMTESKRLPHRCGEWSHDVAVLEDSHTLVLELNQLTSKKEKIEADRGAAKRNANAVLESVTTYKKLWQVWPESHEILKGFDVAPTEPMLPSAPIKALNSALGLPSGAAIVGGVR